MSLVRTAYAGTNTVLRFSTDETDSHQRWIDGRRIYRKVVSLGALPNATTKSVPHNISGAEFFTKISGFATTTPGTTIPLPHPDADSDSIEMYVLGGHIKINSGATDRSIFTVAYAILEYVKD
jgi:hypothetical protein